jgi:hypothetical protein
MKPANAKPANIASDNLSPFFDYLDKEMSFQGAFAAVCGAATAWIAGTLLFAEPSKYPEVLKLSLPVIHLTGRAAARLAAGSFGAAAVLGLTHRGQLARHYGELARHAALNQHVSEEALVLLVRQFGSLRVMRAQWQYYLARGFLVVGLSLLALLGFAA